MLHRKSDNTRNLNLEDLEVHKLPNNYKRKMLNGQNNFEIYNLFKIFD